MNLPATAKNLKPEQWQQVMSLIHPDNVEETLRALHMHNRLVAALEACHALTLHNIPLEAEVAQLLDEESQHAQHPWPPEPKPELETTEPARA